MSDTVFKLDQIQCGPNARRCPNKTKRGEPHGRLGVHVSGAYLICGDKDCKYSEPASLPD